MIVSFLIFQWPSCVHDINCMYDDFMSLTWVNVKVDQQYFIQIVLDKEILKGR